MLSVLPARTRLTNNACCADSARLADGARWAFSRLFVSSALALSLSGCSAGSGSSRTGDGGGDLKKSSVARVDPASLPSDALPTAVVANNAFAADLYARLAANAGSANLVVSPVSASLALGMAYAGAQGTTASEMATALHFSASPGAAIADGQNALSAALQSRAATAQQSSPMLTDGGAQPIALQVVDSVWGQTGFPWSSSFLDVMAASYGSGVYVEDFSGNPGRATDDINGWVKAQTNGAIDPLLTPLDPLTRMVLVNAVYLQLPWVVPFAAASTTTGVFTRADGTTVTATFMSNVTSLPYADDGQAQIVALGLQGGLSVVITVPHAGVSLATYEAGLTGTSPALAVPPSSTGVAVEIPKVDFTTATFSLKAPLQAMGMTQAFESGAADFTGMCPAPTCSQLYVDDVPQRAMIQMNEEGVEAAAATAVVFRDAAAYLGPTQLTANRPYLVAIVDQATRAVLFVGHVTDPTASM